VDWKEAITQELARGAAARQRGNEGMARVCARRAAGWAVQAYLGQRGVDLNTTSVLEHFRYMQKDASQAELLPLLEHLLQPKLRPNIEEDSYFPDGIDLLADANKLIALLFPAGLSEPPA
jgi:hypothetical protein